VVNHHFFPKKEPFHIHDSYLWGLVSKSNTNILYLTGRLYQGPFSLGSSGMVSKSLVDARIISSRFFLLERDCHMLAPVGVRPI